MGADRILDRMTMKISVLACTSLMLCLIATQSQAFMLGGRRVVVYQDEKSTSMTVVSGEGDPLLLVRARVTRTVSDNKSDPAFLVTPPLFRLEPKTRNELRISVLNPGAMPADRESLAYLKVEAIPSSNPLSRDNSKGFQDPLGASMVVGTGNYIKLFYRPHGMGPVTPANYRQLTFARVPGGIKVTNPTPYHITFGRLTVDGKRVEFNDRQPAMMPPLSQQVYAMAGSLKKEVEWSIIDDSSTAQKGTSPIQ